MSNSAKVSVTGEVQSCLNKTQVQTDFQLSISPFFYSVALQMTK